MLEAETSSYSRVKVADVNTAFEDCLQKEVRFPFVVALIGKIGLL